MTYLEWFESHAAKHKKIVDKLLERGFDKTQIIAYFDFDNMVRTEPDFCLLYADQKKCHDMERLNCYLCACPYFRFNDDGIAKADGKTLYSTCAIDAKDGKAYVFGDMIHQDCSGCTVPHHAKYIEKVFDPDWKKMMSECRQSNQ